MKRVYFVSGIDTHVGKSVATGYLANLWLEKGYRVVTQKLVETGNTSDVSEDISMHRQLMGMKLLDEDINGYTCPYLFTHPCSPHLAAQIDQQTISLEKIKDCTCYLLSKYDRVLLEGAGGLMVPLLDDYLTIDFIKDNQYPLILLSSSKLGSLNHTLLSIEACLARHIDIDTIIYNDFPKGDPLIHADTYRYIERYLKKHNMKTKLIKMSKQHV